ncbi:MAG TPA: glycosyltransferase, partial [Spirochaetota bacterium]|nr:glycosyltransferase [Spirochaetota bacterium]
MAKKRLDIPENSLTILFGAENGNEKRKGFHLLLKAIKYCLSNPIFKKMTEDKKLNILCFGDPSSDLNSLNIDIKSMGYIKSDSTLSTVYSASDFVVLPSIEDNLPNIILEAFGCKTPVIAFNTGGMPDMIIHNVTGKLVKAFDEIDLGNKIIETILRPEELPIMGNECRKIIERKFNLEEQARNYSNLYKDLSPESGLGYSSKYYDFSNPAEYKVNMNLGLLNNFRNNDIFKNSFDIYKNLYSLILSNQRILGSYSYKLSVSFFHPEKLFAKIFRFLNKKVKIIPKENKINERKIKVLFDYQIFNLQSHGGISRYFTEIFSCFKKMNIIDYSLPIAYTKNSYLSEKSVIIDGKKKSLFKKEGLDNFFPGINFKGKRRIYALLKKMGFIKSETYFKNKNKKMSVKRLKERNFDLFHPTYYSKYFLEYLGDSPFVLTIHDMIHEIFSDRFPL